MNYYKFLVSVVAALFMETGLSENVFDVVIYGSSPAALTAAIESGRHGKSAIIVCPETRIGGLTTGGLGQTDIGNKYAFGGLALNFYCDVADFYKNPANWKYEERSDYLPDGQCAGSLGADSMWTFEPSAALKILEGWEKKYALKIMRGEYLDRSPGGVIKQGARIVAFKTLSGKVFAGKEFVDATYEGDLMAAAGVSYIAGREPNSRYGERNSGIQRAKSVQHQLNPGVDPYVVKGDPASGLLPFVEPDCPEADGEGDSRIQAYCSECALRTILPTASRLSNPRVTTRKITSCFCAISSLSILMCWRRMLQNIGHTCLGLIPACPTAKPIPTTALVSRLISSVATGAGRRVLTPSAKRFSANT